MTPDPRPTYPRTPAYGEGYASRPVPETSDTVPTADPRGVRLALGLSVVANLVVLLGVLTFGWPAGNVFLLFWCENVVLGLVTLVRVLTAERDASSSSRVGLAAFFCLHYGIFCVVHLVFTVLVATTLGVDRSWLLLGLPVVLLLVRYGVELATTWFGSGGLRRATSPRAAMTQPYPRVVVLHLAVLLTFGAGIFLTVARVPGGPWPRLPELLGHLPPLWQHRGVLAVTLLLVLKTVVDLVTTRRALRPR